MLQAELELRDLLVDIHTVLIDNGDPAEGVVALAAHALEIRQSDKFILQNVGDVGLNILGGCSGIDGDDLDLGERDIRQELHSQTREAVHTEGNESNEDHGYYHRMFDCVTGNLHITFTFCPSSTVPCPSTMNRVSAHFSSITNLVLSAARTSSTTCLAVPVSGS